jgi:exopolysaccharide biosynthesis protein
VFTRIQLALAGLAAAVVVLMVTLSVQSPKVTGGAEQAALDVAAVRTPLGEMRQLLDETAADYERIAASLDHSEGQLAAIRETLEELIAKAEAEKALSAAQKDALDKLVKESAADARKTNDVLDQVLASKLGDPIGQTYGKRATIKVFSLKEAGYRGYMAKVKLHDPSAVKLVLSHDKVGDAGETTSEAAKRTGAKLAINGGGFAKAKGLIYPMGITVVDGKIKTFDVIGDEWSFIGFDKNGRLVGGKIQTREQLEKLNVRHGASFVPTLLKDGKKQPIPSKWRNRKEPRTMIGHFSNGDLLFVVIDGRQKAYSEGVTLEEAQDKLLEFNVRDAYNLDGGGSSTFWYNGKVLNRPSDGRERKLASSFVVLP